MAKRKPDAAPPRETAKNAIFPGQHEGEEVYFVFRQHPLVMRKALILGMLAILVVILPLDFPIAFQIPGLASSLVKLDIVTVIAVLLFWFYRWCLWYYSVFIVTAERTVSILYQTFFKRDTRSLFHSSVHSVDYKVPGLQGVLFSYGNIVLFTWVGDFPINYVYHPAELHEKLLEVIRGAERSAPPGNPAEVSGGA